MLECMIQNNYLANSKGEARRLIRGGAVKINNIPINDESKKITNLDFENKDELKLSAGKKKHILLKIE